MKRISYNILKENEYMIRNNLAKLMIDRNITATQIFNDTGIARSTISKISNNNTDKISMETIDKLCNYLNVTPADFFDYVPYEIEVKLSLNYFDSLQEFEEVVLRNRFDEQEFEIILNLKQLNKKIAIFFNGNMHFQIQGGMIALENVELHLSKESSSEINIIKDLPVQFQKDIIDKIKDEFALIDPFLTKNAVDFDVEIFDPLF